MAISAAPTYDEFIAIYPVFGDVDQGQVDRQLALSTRLLDGPTWQDFYGDAVGLDAAHNLFLYQQACKSAQGAGQATAGPITSVGAAGVNISYANPTWNQKSKLQNWYMKSLYGQQLLMLWEQVVPMGDMAC